MLNRIISVKWFQVMLFNCEQIKLSEVVLSTANTMYKQMIDI